MAKFASASALDGGTSYIKATATKLLLVSVYTVADTYATVVANTLASVVMASTDFTQAASGSNRTLTSAVKSSVATAASTGTDLHLVFTDGTANIVWATDEITNAAFAVGATINYPALVYTAAQPV